MKKFYESIESEYTRFIHLHVMIQDNKDSVNAYYECFYRMLRHQKKTMKHPDDKHFYYYIFITELKSIINVEVLHFSKSIRRKEMKFNEVLKLTKHAE